MVPLTRAFAPRSGDARCLLQLSAPSNFLKPQPALGKLYPRCKQSIWHVASRTGPSVTVLATCRQRRQRHPPTAALRSRIKCGCDVWSLLFCCRLESECKEGEGQGRAGARAATARRWVRQGGRWYLQRGAVLQTPPTPLPACVLSHRYLWYPMQRLHQSVEAPRKPLSIKAQHFARSALPVAVLLLAGATKKSAAGDHSGTQCCRRRTVMPRIARAAQLHPSGCV